MLLTLLIVCATLLIQGSSTSSRHRKFQNHCPDKIIGGYDIDIEKVPWQVALEYTGSFHCGGSIISTNYILTAAHCLYGFDPRYLIVRSGTSKLMSGGTITHVKSTIINPNFGHNTIDYDVGIIALDSPLNFNQKQYFVRLGSYEVLGNELALLTGWGMLKEGGSFSQKLQAVELFILDHGICQMSLPFVLTDRQVCTYGDRKSACKGDSGGALTINAVQYGITSFGNGCTRPQNHGIYSYVPHLRDFIDRNSNYEATWV